MNAATATSPIASITGWASLLTSSSTALAATPATDAAKTIVKNVTS